MPLRINNLAFSICIAISISLSNDPYADASVLKTEESEKGRKLF